MLEVFRVMNKIEGIKEEDFFIRDLKGGREHSFKLFKKSWLRRRLDVEMKRLDVVRFSFW